MYQTPTQFKMYMNLPYKSGTRMLKPSQVSIWILDEIFKVCQMQRISSLKNLQIISFTWNFGYPIMVNNFL